MSRNFELLERVQQDRELFRVPSIVKATPGNGRSSEPLRSDPDAFVREEILRLVQSLFLATTNGNGQSHRQQVVFCGIENDQGSSLLCGQVARRLAEQVQSQVCIVDANVRCPISGLSVDPHESDGPHQEKHSNKQKNWQRVTDNLWVATRDSFGTNGGVSALDQVRVLMKGLRDEQRYVIINAPPVGLYSDAARLGQAADGVVLVLEANSTRRVAARQAKQALEAGNVRVLGIVLNNRTFPIPEKIYRWL